MLKKKIVILHAQVPFATGGAEFMVQSLKKNLITSGFDTEIAAVPFKWYPEQSLYDNMLIWRLLDLSEANGEKIDLVIGTKFPSYGAIHEKKVIWMIQQYRQAYDLYDSPYGLANQKNGNNIKVRVENYDKLTVSEAKAVYTISKNVAERLKKYNDLDSEALYPPPPLIGKYKKGEFGDYICAVGRLDKLKRNELLIEALPHCDSHIKVKFAGRGPEMESLMNLAKKLNVQDQVEFLGFVPDEELLDLYANARGVYFAPIDEDYGFITLEAFLSGKPIITCNDTGGVLEFVNHDFNGFICDATPLDVAEKLNVLWNNKERCKEMGEYGYQLVKGISWDNVIQKLTSYI